MDINETLTEEGELYALPLYQRAIFKRRIHVVFSFIILLFGSLLLLPTDEISVRITFLLFLFGFAFLWIGTAVWRRPYLKLTDEHLEYRWLFGHHIIPFESIRKVSVFSDYSALLYGVWADQQGRLSFWQATDRWFGRDYTIALAIASFPNIDFERLHSTIKSRMKH